VFNSFFDFCNNCFNDVELVLLLLAIVSLFFLFFYYLYFFIKLSFYSSSDSNFNKPLSIIICAKNEFVNLQKNLPVILAQNYVSFEVIVVNDQSTDTSKSFLEELAAENSNLVVVNIDDFVTHPLGKKFALTLGIKTAKHEHLLLTDADCVPNSLDWARQMSANFNHANIIIGYGAYEKKKGFLNNIIRFDTFNVAQQYLSFSINGLTYMGVGRNLAYKKSLFFDNKGFASHIHIPSGDDDLFVQEISVNNSVAVEISECSHTTSRVIGSWKEWAYQKRRHISTSSFYKLKFKLLLGIYPLAQLLFLLSVIFLLISGVDLVYIIVLLVPKLILSYLVNYKVMRKLNVFDLYWIHPLYEILNLLIQGNFVLLNLFRKPRRWSR
tara:strand:+ start:11298 stop:12443 length:1146 start_codon:yes stop_codon:yes gene_type:complete